MAYYKLSVLLLSLCGMLVLGSCRATDQYAVDTLSFTSPNGDYTLRYPATFEIQGETTGFVLIVGPLRGPERQSAQAGMGILYWDGALRGYQTIDELMNAEIRNEEWTAITFNELEAATLDSSPGPAVGTRQVWILHNGEAYTLGFNYVSAEFPDAVNDAQLLWDIVSTSFTFLE